MKLHRFLFIFIVLLLCCGCSKNKSYTKSGFYFDTVVTITLYDNSKEDLIDECFQICEEWENKISRTKKESDIYRINSSNGNPTKVSKETIELLEKGIYYSELTNGVFDITIAPLTDLWDSAKNTSVLPDSTQVQNALSNVDYRTIQIDGNYVSLTNPLAAIDLGGIAKGYIADDIKDYFVQNNVKHAIINIGGNILTIGNKPNGSPFEIAIAKPFSETNTPITSANVTDLSVVTSGIYERYFKVNDELYHHIIDTSTGYPCKTNLLSATILSDSSTEADVLSTVCMILGEEKALELIRQHRHIDAILITDTYEIIDTRQNNN